MFPIHSALHFYPFIVTEWVLSFCASSVAKIKCYKFSFCFFHFPPPSLILPPTDSLVPLSAAQTTIVDHTWQVSKISLALVVLKQINANP